MEVLILGATGLVGSELLRLLQADTSFTKIHTPGRRELREELPSFVRPQIVFCCLGTTIRVAGSQDAFQEVDHRLVIRLAGQMLNRGAVHFLGVSAVGADSQSGIFYNRVKGLMEAELQSLGYPQVTILRPSLIVGNRREPRRAEQVSAFFMLKLKPLIPKRWRAVRATQIAASMVGAAKQPRSGVRFIENAEISMG